MVDLARARELLSGLADGVNPLTGEILPDDSVWNQAEIVRALNAVLNALPKGTKTACSYWEDS
jgi:ethanolamine utilization microcompartment shell protein EutL